MFSNAFFHFSAFLQILIMIITKADHFPQNTRLTVSKCVNVSRVTLFIIKPVLRRNCLTRHMCGSTHRMVGLGPLESAEYRHASAQQVGGVFARIAFAARVFV